MSIRVVIAPDKFKGSLTAVEAVRAMAAGVRLTDPEARVSLCPMADGGEGTIDAVLAAGAGQRREAVVRGPLPGQEVTARWAVLPAGRISALADDSWLRELLAPGEQTAVVEMAQASGTSLIPKGKLDPMVTSTVGTGDLITEALDAGCRQVIVGIGGSGTVDGGTGMATALGYRFLDGGGNELTGEGASLLKIDSIEISGRDSRLSETRFVVASDVDNPLVGPQGAAVVFGPQKGASPDEVEMLDAGLRRLAKAISQSLCIDLLNAPGAGAAGGLGAGLLAFCGARMASGIRLVAALTGLEAQIEGADLVLTGEGSFDSQTARGKVPAGVVEIAREYGVPAVVVAGRIGDGIGDFLGPGTAAYSILPEPMELSKAEKRAAELLESGTARLMRLLNLLPGGKAS